MHHLLCDSHRVFLCVLEKSAGLTDTSVLTLNLNLQTSKPKKLLLEQDYYSLRVTFQITLGAATDVDRCHKCYMTLQEMEPGQTCGYCKEVPWMLKKMLQQMNV